MNSSTPPIASILSESTGSESVDEAGEGRFFIPPYEQGKRNGTENHPQFEV
jgi:hypothetical protein